MNTGEVNYNSTSASGYVDKTAKSDKKSGTEKTGKITGRTVGNPELSDKAAKYYEQLKAKFGNMEFVLVSKDKKEQAQANAASYANSSKTVVLIDEEKVERMAEDENYRSQYESLISGAAANLKQIQSGMSSSSGVTSYGIKINDNGTASYFAVIDKSLAAQKERIEKNAKKKAEEKKADAKKEQEEKTADDGLKAMVEDMIAKRNAARKEKDFAAADAIRDELLSKGIEIKDTREGTVWKLI